MHSKPNPNDPEARELLARIRRDFGEILRGHGVSLHETWVIDRYGSMRERKKARKLDTDQHWWEVRDEWIEEFGGVGGLSFLDDKGFTYYLPDELLAANGAGTELLELLHRRTAEASLQAIHRLATGDDRCVRQFR